MIRCPVLSCGKLLAERLEGVLVIVCSRCGTRTVFDKRPEPVLESLIVR
jgi:DNA-directed RNA polymerase subunit RPC12/RpoP